MGARVRYCVGHESDPDKVEQVVRGLRILARLGRRAERALAAMGRGEEFGPVVWLGRPSQRITLSQDHSRTWLGSGLEGLCLNTARSLSPFRPTSRDDVPGWANLSVEFGKLDEEIISKSTVRFFQLRLSGTGVHFRDGRVSPFRLSSPGNDLGEVRLKRDGSLTLSPQYHAWAVPEEMRKVIRIPAGGPGLDRAARRLADVAATALVRGPYSRLDEDSYPRELVDLRKEVPGWLLEDGSAQRWIAQIREHAASIRAVSDVMEG